MSLPKGYYLGGVRDVLSLRNRCRVDDCTDCWHYLGGSKVRVTIKGRSRSLRLRAASVVVARGRWLPRHIRAFAAPDCESADCANPDHAVAGTHQQSMAAAAVRGAYKTLPLAIYRAQLAERTRKLSREDRLAIQGSDESPSVVAARHGIHPAYVSQLRREAARRPARSVFEWSPA